MNNVMYLQDFVNDIGQAKPIVKCLKRDIKIHIFEDTVWVIARNYSSLVAGDKTVFVESIQPLALNPSGGKATQSEHFVCCCTPKEYSDASNEKDRIQLPSILVVESKLYFFRRMKHQSSSKLCLFSFDLQQGSFTQKSHVLLDENNWLLRAEFNHSYGE